MILKNRCEAELCATCITKQENRKTIKKKIEILDLENFEKTGSIKMLKASFENKKNKTKECEIINRKIYKGKSL